MTLESLKSLFAGHKPVEIPWRRFLPRAAVAVVFRSPGPEILFIKRSERADDPWSGDMAFPGGRMEPSDESPMSAALRELSEETGIGGDAELKPLGRLSDVPTRTHAGFPPMTVTPYALELSGEPDFTDNHEVRERLWVPLDFFLDAANRKTMIWRFIGRNWTVPCYNYEGRRIWGLSLIVMDEVIALARGERPGARAWMLRLAHKI